MRGFGQWIILLIWSTFAASLAAAQTTSQPATAVCTFADGPQISVQYDRESTNTRALHSDEVWMPGGLPMILFTQTALSVGNVNVPIGAYSLYIICVERQSTLVVNKNVSPRAKYDQQQDIMRVPMQSGSLAEPVSGVQVVFAHMAPKQCNMRLYRAKKGVWASFQEK
jgi:hypothetical protein